MSPDASVSWNQFRSKAKARILGLLDRAAKHHILTLISAGNSEKRLIVYAGTVMSLVCSIPQHCVKYQLSSTNNIRYWLTDSSSAKIVPRRFEPSQSKARCSRISFISASVQFETNICWMPRPGNRLFIILYLVSCNRRKLACLVSKALSSFTLC